MDGSRETPLAQEAGSSSQDSRASLRPIRALLRGLECLMVLNTRDGVTVTEIARAARLPRTTAHRILETLCDGGYIVRDNADERYRATILVRALSDGFGDESWVREIAKPELDRLGRKLLYPLSVCTASGLSLVVRENTDKDSPLALERLPPGTRQNLIQTAAGRLYLSYMSPAQRRAMLDVLARTGGRPDPALRNRDEFDTLLDRVRHQGWCLHHAPPNREASIAVPIHTGDEPVAFLAMRYIASAVTPKEAVASYLPQIAESAQRIARSLTGDATPAILAEMTA